eukprot:TRINITY_DN7953_c0_g1_i1.p1 TRINITY_DN7953_c0_g1~~TRINITY_DN7953_c0_g1_i1.p1  ORF type:complete len:424 (+),score=159.80 TRINITY_DN7953_c0_g1_i1:29-1273(+)
MNKGQAILAKGDTTALPHWGAVLNVSTAWEYAGGKKTVDLDVSCVTISSNGEVLDAVYFNQLNSKDGSVSHSGDTEVKGKDTGYEGITIRTSMIHPDVKALVLLVNCYKSGSFSDIERGTTVISDSSNNAELIRLPFDIKSHETAIVLAVISKDASNSWTIKNVSESGSGRSFIESDGLIRRELVKIPGLTFPEIVIWNVATPTFNMEKGNWLKFDNLKSLVVGLGWDVVKEGTDLDASAMCYSKTGQFLDLIYFRKLVSSDGAIEHSGDNRTGAGDGDDEKIYIDLEKVHEEVSDIFCAATIYNGAATFKAVKNSHCRLSDRASGNEMCHYRLREFKDENGVVFCRISRDPTTPKGWKVLAVGDSVTARHPTALVPLIQVKYLNVSQDAATYIPIPPLAPQVNREDSKWCSIL